MNSITLDSTSLAAGGGTATLTLSYTAPSSGAFRFDLSLVNTDADENPFNVRISGTAQAVASSLQLTSGSNQSTEINQTFAAPLVVTATTAGGAGVAGVVVTFTAPATGASLIFASTGTNTESVTTGSDGTATSSGLTANGIASGYQGSPTLMPYTVTASAPGLTGVSFTMTNTRNDQADIRKTQEVIASFVTGRANNIVSNQPNLVSRLARNVAGHQGGVNRLAFNATSGAHSGSFQFSYRAFAEEMRRRNDGTAWRSSLNSPTTRPPALEDGTNRQVTTNGVPPSDVTPARASPFPGFDQEAQVSRASVNDAGDASLVGQTAWSGWDFWAQGTYAISKNIHSKSKSGLLFAGVDYTNSDRAVFGVMGQLDFTEEENGAANTSAQGLGWMIGPYAVIRLQENLYLDASATYGQSRNKVNALGLFEDDFETERILVQAGLTGDFELNPTLTVSPFARVTYYHETQESYTDSLGRTIPSQDFDLGRLEFGPKLSWEINRGDSLQFAPYVSFSGIYDFNKLQDSNPTDATLASSDSDFRGRLEAGATWFMPDRDIKISVEGFYDGIGAAGFESYGASLSFRMPF